MLSDTICALATAAVDAGIGIVRISGADACALAGKMLRTKSGKALDISESHRVRYGFVCDGDEVLDEVLVITLRAPRSFTGEDTVEINCHGGVLMQRRILELALKCGARLAEAGEFTKRAFLNGRMDLSEAEAVADVISAGNDYALKASMSQLRGSVSAKIKALRARILEDVAYIEAALDDPEHISLEGFSEQLLADLADVSGVLRRLIDSADNGKVIKEGIRTVIVGKPNAGKSTLMNVLLGEERAIVTDIAGTTRDTLEETLSLSGVTLHVVDTAGIRDTDDVVERIGVERALKAAENADLIIYVVDASAPLDEADEQILTFIQGRRCIVLLNKSDLKTCVAAETLAARTGCFVLSISAKEEQGIEALEAKIKELFYQGEIDFNSQVIITSARHKALLVEAEAALKQVEASVLGGMPEDFYTIDLMHAYTVLGYILGEEVSEDLVNKIFAKFCMGK